MTDYVDPGERNLEEWLAELARFDEAGVGVLENSAKHESSDQAIDAERDLEHADIDQAYQANALREKFYGYVVRIVTGTMVVSILLVGLYMWSEWSQIPGSVMIAWFGSSVVQVLGLGYIVARYLFAPRGQIAPGVQPGTAAPASE